MTFEERMAELGVDLSDLPEPSTLVSHSLHLHSKTYDFIKSLYGDSWNGADRTRLFLSYILHLTDIIDRMETRLDNQTTLLKNLLHVIANADIPEDVTYEQFCLVVDSIYKAVQFAQEGWETYEAGIPKEGSAGDERT